MEPGSHIVIPGKLLTVYIYKSARRDQVRSWCTATSGEPQILFHGSRHNSAGMDPLGVQNLPKKREINFKNIFKYQYFKQNWAKLL